MLGSSWEFVGDNGVRWHYRKDEVMSMCIGLLLMQQRGGADILLIY